MTRKELYRIWWHIKDRCYNERNPRYVDYGGRRIRLWSPWKRSFDTFSSDLVAAIGPRPSKAHSLDRIDNNKGYRPGNLRWATAAQQNRNSRHNRTYTWRGETKLLVEWAEDFGVPYERVVTRLRKGGWTLEKALTTPVRKRRAPKRRQWLTPDVVRAIKAQRRRGVPLDEIGRRLRVNPNTVRSVVYGKSWKAVS